MTTIKKTNPKTSKTIPVKKTVALPDLRPILLDLNRLVMQYSTTINPSTMQAVATPTALLSNRQISGEGKIILSSGVKTPFSLNGWMLSRSGDGYHGESVFPVRNDRDVNGRIRELASLGMAENNGIALNECVHNIGALLVYILTGRQTNPGKRERGYTTSTQARILINLMDAHSFTFESVSTSNRHSEGEKGYELVECPYNDVLPSEWRPYLRVIASGLEWGGMEASRKTRPSQNVTRSKPEDVKVVLE